MERLTRTRWVDEGLLVLAKDGAAALAADRMAKRLGVSRGSFYWHFKNALDFEAAVLGAWEDRWTHRIIATVEGAAATPRERLFALIEKTGGEDASLYSAAKRMARQHPELREVMDRVDVARIGFVARLMTDGGVAESKARLRARIIYAWAMGQMLVSGHEQVPAETASALVTFAFSQGKTS